MAESHGFIKILPDSTGKRIPHGVMMEVEYDTGTIAFAVGDIITGVTSGLLGTVVEVVGTTTAGSLHITLEDPNVPATPAFVVGENLQVNAATVAKAATAGYPFYFQQSQLAGGKDPTHLLEIDKKGAASVRFDEGSPTFDAFGKMLVAQQTTIAEYLHKYNIDTDNLSVNLTGAGAAAHIPESAGVVLSVGTASGDKAEMVSHYYHPYHLGMGRLIEFTSCCGDTGKTNLKRIWGYGDDDDGCFFMQHNGIWYVRIKSTAGGTPTDLMIPQSEWNGDQLDGLGGVYNRSLLNFDLTKMNITWIDLQWLGIGTVRFGVVVNGERIVCHRWHHGNADTKPYMRTGSLPVYHEITNAGAVGSGSEFRLWCTVVKNGGIHKTPSVDYAHIPSAISPASTTPVVATSIRATPTINSITNRKSSFLKSIDVLSVTAPVIIEVWKGCTLTTPSWAVARDATSALDFDEVGTVSAFGRRIFGAQVDQQGVSKLDLTDVFHPQAYGIRRHFNPANYDIYTITARRVTGTGATVVSLSMNWDDV